MKAGWEVRPLGEVATLQRGFDLPKKQRKPGAYPLVTSSGPTDFHCEAKVSGPGVVTGRSGSIGNVYFIEDDFWPLNTALYVKDFHGNDERFVWYLLESFDLKRFASGAGVPTLNRNDVHGEKVPLPPLEEQKRLVAVLDAAFEGLTRARTHIETNLQNARELFDSALFAVFSELEQTAERYRLPDVSTQFARGKSKHRPRNDPTLYNGDYPFIQTGDVRNSFRLIEEYTQTYNETGLAQSKLWPAGTVCITIAANIAETGVLAFDACFPDSVIGMVPEPDRSDSFYVEYLLQFFQKRLQARGEGAAQKNINLKTFETELFPFPDLQRQLDAVTLLDAAAMQKDNLERSYKAKLQDLDDLRQSLLQKAFAGELT